MIGAVRADPAAYNTTEAKLATFERLMVTLNQTIMIGNSISYMWCIYLYTNSLNCSRGSI